MTDGITCSVTYYFDDEFCHSSWVIISSRGYKKIAEVEHRTIGKTKKNPLVLLQL